MRGALGGAGGSFRFWLFDIHTYKVERSWIHQSTYLTYLTTYILTYRLTSTSTCIPVCDRVVGHYHLTYDLPTINIDSPPCLPP